MRWGKALLECFINLDFINIEQRKACDWTSMTELEQAISSPGPIPDTFALKDKLAETKAIETWLAFDRAKKRRLILKKYSLGFFRDLFGDTEKLLDTFFADCAAFDILTLRAPETFLKIISCGHDETNFWFARETAGDNRDVITWRNTGKPPQLAEVLKRFAIISGTVVDFHREGVFHGNLHPGNLYISGLNSAIIADPDIGHLRAPGFYSCPVPGDAFVRTDYFAPEQRPESPGTVDLRTDIWGIGASIAFALSGKTPAELNPEELPPGIREVVRKSMQSDPGERFASMKDMRSELTNLQKSLKPSFAMNSVDAPEEPKPPVPQAPVESTSATNVNPKSAAQIPPELKCPQCSAPVVPNSRICPKCRRSYDEPCLNCQALNPFWLRKCRGCGGDVVQLKQQMAEKLYNQQQQIMKLCEIYSFEKALILAKMISQVTHPDFARYREWAKNMLPTIQKNRRDIRNYIEGVRMQSNEAMAAQKYELVQQIIEQVPSTLLDEDFRKMYSEAGECITEVDSLIREIRNAIVTKKYNSLLSTVQRYLELKANDPEAKVLQEKIEKLTTVTSVTGSKFRRIPPGKFYMGSHESDVFIRNNERPQHRVTITKPFFIGIYPVLQDEFNRVMEFNPSVSADDPNCPVDNVTWFSALEYCNRLSEMEGYSPYYEINVQKRRTNGLVDAANVKILGGDGYRLPTEAEWEYACRAGSISPWCFGDQVMEVSNYAWYFENSQNESHPVGQKKPNAWGLFDMHGNLLEWCYDWYGEFYYQQCNDIEDPLGPETGTAKSLRGGAWQFGAEATRSPYRNSSNPESSSSVVGFRILRAAPEDSSEEIPRDEEKKSEG